jgi:alkanesulfonate monooxygenase SsuD/methylene tetrahydromethanopterin reductase-like flavin-dependent oxidoreductase (luciferase family)
VRAVKVGVSLFMQNYTDWDRYEAMEKDPTVASTPPRISDAKIFQDHLHLGRQIEPLGFDSIWTVEHHFTPYTMINNPCQFLSYFAGCTDEVEMGTMVMVLPWHDPIRLAEEIIMLDHMLDGRKFKVGLGRGLGDREFDGFRIPMGETRDRFKEQLHILRAAIKDEWFSYDGTFNSIPRTSIRPMPRDRRALLNQLYMAWGSPASLPVAAEEDLKPLFIPSRSWAEYREEVGTFNRIRTEHGWEPQRSSVLCWVYCAETEQKAFEGAARWMPEYGDSSLRHYRFTGDHLKKIKGYEYYVQMGEEMKAAGQSGMDFGDVYLNNHVYGTPEQCVERLKFINEQLAVEEFILVFDYASMSIEAAQASMKLFAEEALSEVKKIQPVPIVVGEPVAS